MTSQAGSWLRFLAALGLIGGAGLLLHSRGEAEKLPPRRDLARLPIQLAGWEGHDLAIAPEIREILGAGEFLERSYLRSPDEPGVDLFLAYFPSQRMGSTIHSPQNCLPGSGWTPFDFRPIVLETRGGRSVTANRYVLGKGSEKMLVIYWYQAHGRVIASEYWAKFYLVADAIRMNRSDGALVRILTPLAGGENLDRAERRVVEFAAAVSPSLDEVIPP